MSPLEASPRNDEGGCGIMDRPVEEQVIVKAYVKYVLDIRC